MRSSSTIEDIAGARAPGVFQSVRTDAELTGVLRAIRTVWISALAEGAERYRRHLGLGPADAGMAVVVQIYIEARLGGVIYTLEPVTNDPARLVVSWIDGDPTTLLAGERMGSTATSGKADSALSATVPDSIRAAVAEARRLEREFNEPLDIEFVVDSDHGVNLVQCRPLTYVPRCRERATLVEPAHQENTLRSPKIRAVRLNYLGGGDLTGQFVIRPPAFEALRQTGSFPDELRTQLVHELTGLLKGGDVALRPAYWSALNSADNMPQSGHLRATEECLRHLERLWSYVIENRLDDYSAEVAVLAGNWLSVSASAVVAAHPADRRVKVDAAPGYPEGLENQPYNTYTVDLDSGHLVDQRSPGYLAAVDPHGDNAPERWLTGGTLVLTEHECVRAAEVARNIAREQHGPVRVEFMTVLRNGARSLIVWQVDSLHTALNPSTFRLTVGHRIGAEGLITGTATRVTSIADLASVAQVAGPRNILVLDIRDTKARDRDAHTVIAEHAARLSWPVVIRASPLSHLSALLRDYGSAVYAVREIPAEIGTGSDVTITPE